MSYYLGIDIGTSSVKLTAIDENGRVAASCSRDYTYDQPQPGWREIHPSVWENGALEGLEELLGNIDRSQVKSIGFTGQMHTTVFLDEHGKCIRPAIMWNDMRTKDRIAYMKEQLAGKEDAEMILRILSTGSPAANLLWVKEQEPENFEKLDKFLIGPDYLVYRFCGKYTTDYCEASTSSLYDLNSKCWSESMRQLLGLSLEQFPPVKGSEEVAGTLKQELRRQFDLPTGIKIVVGTGDNPAAAVATGAIQGAYPVLSIGTSGVLVLSRDRLRTDSKGKQILFSLDGEHLHVLVQGVVQSAGGTYHWYVKNLLGETDFSKLTETIDWDNLGNGELLFYPHLTGDKTIYADPTLRGALIGIDIKDTKADIAVAVMEGISFAFKQLIEAMNLSEEELSQLKVTGGGSDSPLWMQILSDILNVRIEQLDGGEGASYGAALMAKNAVSEKAAEIGSVKIRGYFEPREIHAKRYAKKYQAYLKIHDALQLLK